MNLRQLKEGKMIIDSFSPEVTDQIGHYVYRLIDPRNGETFYVGRGQGNRVFDHIRSKTSKNGDNISDKISRIKDIQLAGLDVIHIIHRHGMSIEMAREVEAALIDIYPSATNIQGGYNSGEYGPMNAIEIENKYSAQEANFKHKVIMITINKSISERDIYNAVRFAWRASLQRARRANFILAVKQGIICGVFVANEWKEATTNNFPLLSSDRTGRIGFNGNEADTEVSNLYLSKRVPQKYRQRGASNPIKYNYR